jgi:hypothetical protein
MGPIIFRRAHRNAERFGGFVMRQADKVTELHHLSFERMDGCELVERFVDGEQLIVVAGERQFHLLQFHALLAAAVAHGALLSGAVNENPPHRFSRRGKKMRPVLESRRLDADEPQPGLVNQGSGLERVSRRFIDHLARGEPAQFFVDQRQQLVGSFGIAAFNGAENLGRLTHAWRKFDATMLAKVGRIVTDILSGVSDSRSAIRSMFSANGAAHIVIL